MAAPYDALGPWVVAPADRTQPLCGHQRADVVVVGGGYTGLSTALCLREEGADVALLEADFAGSGASGRNAGHLTPTIGKDLPTLLRLFGRERAAALVRFADRAVEYTESQIEKLSIQCHYEPSGNLLAAVSEAQLPRLERAARVGAELGARLRFVAPDEARERGLPAAFLGGVLEECGGTLDPGRYVLGLRRAALAAGVRLYEASPVRRLERGPPARLHTARGTLRGEQVVLATNAWTPGLGFEPRAVLPLRVTLFETAPLSPRQREAVGWPGGEGIYTAHEQLESYRPTHRGSLVGGAKRVRYRFGSGLAPGHDPRVFRVLERAFRDRFPQLAGLPIERFWGGWIALPLDFLPWVGCSVGGGPVHYAFGYAGHGVAQATLAGRMLADAVLGREHPALAALARRPLRLPPEPLRWLLFRGLERSLAAVDAWTDRGLRRRA